MKALFPFLVCAALMLVSCAAHPGAERRGTDCPRPEELMHAPQQTPGVAEHVERLDDEHILLARDVGSGVYDYELRLYQRRGNGAWVLVGQDRFSTARLWRRSVMEEGCLRFIDAEGQTIHRMNINRPSAA